MVPTSNMLPEQCYLEIFSKHVLHRLIPRVVTKPSSPSGFKPFLHLSALLRKSSDFFLASGLAEGFADALLFAFALALLFALPLAAVFFPLSFFSFLHLHRLVLLCLLLLLAVLYLLHLPL